jgi:hypothetical protein
MTKSKHTPSLPADIRQAIDNLITTARRAEFHHNPKRQSEAYHNTVTALAKAREALEDVIREELNMSETNRTLSTIHPERQEGRS